MARHRITERTLAKDHYVEGQRLELWDELLPGFGVRISGSGVKSFYVFTRLHHKPLRISLGKYPALSLADAREAARRSRTSPWLRR